MRNSSRLLISGLLLGLGVFTLCAAAQEKPAAKIDTPRYKDATLPIADRVADLLPRMTLEEKVDQLNWDWQQKVEVIDPTGTYTSGNSAEDAGGGVGSGDLKFTPRNAAILRNAVQRYQLEKTRLGIPVMFPGRGAARIHGVRQHQLSAGAGTGQHVRSGAGEARVHRGWR